MKKNKNIEIMRNEIKKVVKNYSVKDLKNIENDIEKLKDEAFVNSLTDGEVMKYFALLELVVKDKNND